MTAEEKARVKAIRKSRLEACCKAAQKAAADLIKGQWIRTPPAKEGWGCSDFNVVYVAEIIDDAIKQAVLMPALKERGIEATPRTRRPRR